MKGLCPSSLTAFEQKVCFHFLSVFTYRLWESTLSLLSAEEGSTCSFSLQAPCPHLATFLSAFVCSFLAFPSFPAFLGFLSLSTFQTISVRMSSSNTGIHTYTGTSEASKVWNLQGKEKKKQLQTSHSKVIPVLNCKRGQVSGVKIIQLPLLYFVSADPT